MEALLAELDALLKHVHNPASGSQAAATLSKLRKRVRRLDFERQFLQRETSSLKALMRQVEADYYEKTNELEEKNRRLAVAQQLAEDAARAKADFLATMSHELRTPLNGIIGMTSILAETALDTEQTELVGATHRSGAILLAIVDDILDFSKLEAGRVELVSEPVHLLSLLEGAVEVVGPQSAEKALEVVIDVEPGTPHWVEGDGLRLRQVLVNFLSDAVKFTHRGYISLNVASVDPDGKPSLRFSVTDTGIGIPNHKQGDLFDSFSQVDPTTTRKYGGTGLGLAISRQLALRMGGDIGVESEPGLGSTFWFSIPLEKVAQPPKTELPARELEGASFFIVSSSLPMALMLASIAEALGMEPVLSSSPSEVVDRARWMSPEASARTVVMVDAVGRGQQVSEWGRAISEALPRAALARLEGFQPSPPDEVFKGTLRRPVRRRCFAQLVASLLRPGVRSATRSVPVVEEHLFPPGFRVLLAEDNPVNQRLMQLLMRRLGVEVQVAADGLEAIDCVHEGHFDLILMDLHMPNLGGIEAARRIRSEFDRGPPIVALTADVRTGVAEECLASGMEGYLTKPIDRAKLVETMKRYA